MLIGMGNYRAGAAARAGRWLVRMGLVVVLVQAGFSITGALLGVIGSSLAELLLSRWYLGAGMFIKQAPVPLPIQRYGALLFLSSICLIFFNGMDLFMLKILGGTAAQAGIYSAAQSLSLLPGLFSWTFSSLLLATLSRQLADCQQERARELARDAMRVTMFLLPVAAIIAGAATEIVQVVFGAAFLPAGPLLGLLIVGAVSNVMLMVSITIMTAAGLPARTIMFTAPLVLLALVSHLVLILRFGQQGAALVTVVVSSLGAIAAGAGVYALWKVWPPVGTVIRSLAIGQRTAAEVFMPLTVGGGIRDLNDIRDLLNAGADKVSVNTAVVENIRLLEEASQRFGSQCIVVAIDAKRTASGTPGRFEVYTYGGRKPTGIDVVSWAERAARLGAGEILLTSMDRDGTKDGYDLDLTRAVSERVIIPFIASGGAGTFEHFYDAFALGKADAALAASVFHYRTFTIRETKRYLQERGIPVRL